MPLPPLVPMMTAFFELEDMKYRWEVVASRVAH